MACRKCAIKYQRSDLDAYEASDIAADFAARLRRPVNRIVPARTTTEFGSLTPLTPCPANYTATNLHNRWKHANVHLPHPNWPVLFLVHEFRHRAITRERVGVISVHTRARNFCSSVCYSERTRKHSSANLIVRSSSLAKVVCLV